MTPKQKARQPARVRGRSSEVRDALAAVQPLSVLIQQACEDRGITMEEASIQMGEAKNAVSRWTNPRYHLPGPEKYEKIAAWLGITIPEFGAALTLEHLRIWEQYQRD